MIGKYHAIIVAVLILMTCSCKQNPAVLPDSGAASPECHVRLAPLLALKDDNNMATISMPAHNNLDIKSIRFVLASTRGLGGLERLSLSKEGECIAWKRLSRSTNKAGFVIPLNIRADSSLTFSVGLRTKDAIDLDNIIEIKKVILNTSEGRKECRISGSPRIRMGIALRQAGQDGCDNCRIPGLAITEKGTLIAVYDARWDMDRDLQGNIDICCNRSTDGGRTWSPMSKILDMGAWGDLPEKYNGVSDASITVDSTTGDIYVAGTWMYGILDESDGHFVEGLDESSTAWNHQWRAHGSQPGYDVRQSSQMIISKSPDDGLTWSEPENITRQVKPEGWWLMTTAPGAGITLSDGTIVIPAQGRDENGMAISTIITSRDHGRSWTAGTRITDAVPSNECMAAELSDGSIMLNCRSTVNRGRKNGNGRIIGTTKDLGQTWCEHPTSRNALIEPTCQASIIKVGDRLFFFNPNDTDRRVHHTLKCSTDDGMTWPVDLQIELDEDLGAGYSCMVAIDDHTLGILYEGSGANLVFQRVRF